MGIRDWLEKKATQKGASHVNSCLAKLIPIADASWQHTLEAMRQNAPIPRPDHRVREGQEELLKALTFWKGPLDDATAVGIVASRLATAGPGSKMAIRTVLLDWWPTHGSPTVSMEELERQLGSREDDILAAERVAAYIAETGGR